jgi:hypothetical protein
MTHPVAIFACPSGRQRGLSVIVVIVVITVLIIVLVVHCHSVALQYFDNSRFSFSRGTCCQKPL